MNLYKVISQLLHVLGDNEEIIQEAGEWGDDEQDALEAAQKALGKNYHVESDDVMAVALSGNLSEGFRACGPYRNFDEAAEKHEGDECWIMTLESAKNQGFIIGSRDPGEVSTKEVIETLARTLAALETPDDLTEEEKLHVQEDAAVLIDRLNKSSGRD